MADEETLELVGGVSGEEAPAAVVKKDINDDASSSRRQPSSSMYERFDQWRHERYILPRHYKLQTEEDTRKYSLWSVNFMITCSAINTKLSEYCTSCGAQATVCSTVGGIVSLVLMAEEN